MKIAVDALAAKSLYHGTGVYIGNILKYLTVRTDMIFIIYAQPGFSQFLREPIFQIKTIPLTRSLRIGWEQAILPFSLKKNRVNLFWGPSNFLPSVKVCPYIVTIHDLSPFIFSDSYPLLRRFYYQNLIRNSVRLADYIITVSQSTKQDLIKLFSVLGDKIRVIYNGVSDDFHRIERQSELFEVREKYQLPKEFIFTLGVLEPKKNTERLIRAYAELISNPQSTIRNFKLVIGGSRKYGWKNSRVFQLVKSLNLQSEIIFTDLIEHKDLPAVYNLAKVFVFPSLYEGFGLPVLEAMACGTPVITSNTSSLPEVAGDAAVLVNPYEVSEIAQAIRDVLSIENLRMTMSEKGLKNARRFSWKKAAEELLSVFEETAYENYKSKIKNKK